MSKEDWVWMPHPGHFCAAKDCRFFLNTYVNGYIVSTVGEYWPDSAVRKIFANSRGKDIEGIGDYFDANYLNEFGYEKIGFDRLYETMVFKAESSDERDSCCPFRAYIRGGELVLKGYNDPTDAYKGHLEICNLYDSISNETIGSINL